MSEAVSTQSKRSRLRLVLFAVVVLLALVALVVIRQRAQSQPPRGASAQVVTVARARLGSMPQTLSELGTVTPVSTVTVLPQLSGFLTAVGYREGQEVQKGQFLAQIDPRQYEISKQQAEAQLAKDRAVLAQAESDLARYRQLNERKSIAEQTFTDQQFAVQQAEAAVKADQASIAQYLLDLAYCHITAPISGRVGLRLVDPGNYVTASSSPGIVVITSMKPTTVQFSVPQDELGAVLQHMKTSSGLTVSAYSSDNSKLIATGKLYAVGNQIATGTGTVTLRATFANEDEALFPNEFVNVKLLVNTLDQVVLVPTPAVQSGAPGDYVYRVNADDTVSVRKVTLGPSDGRNTVITEGLEVDDAVVIDGTDRLSDGARIKRAAAQGAKADAGSGKAPGQGTEPTSDAPSAAAVSHRHSGQAAAAASQ